MNSTQQTWVIFGGLALIAYALTREAASDGAAVLGDVGDGLTPWSSDNWAYGGVNAIGSTLTGNQDWTLGGAFYDTIHTDNGGLVIDPSNDENPIYSGVNAAGQYVTGDSAWSLGGWFHEVFHGDPTI